MYLKYFYFTQPSQIFLTGVCKMLDQLALFRCEKLRTMRQPLSRDRKNRMSDFWTIPKNWFIHQLNTYPASRPPPTEEVTRSLLVFTQTRFFMILISDIFGSCFIYCHCLMPELSDCLLNVCVAHDGQMRVWGLVSVTTFVTTSERDVTSRDTDRSRSVSSVYICFIGKLDNSVSFYLSA